MTPDPATYFWRRVYRDDPADCWLWLAGVDRDGYGYAFMYRRRMGAHRMAYLLLVGPIPEGLEIDHLCLQRNCVNPGHLAVVTHAQNMRLNAWSRRTHCPRGHAYDASNTHRDRRGHRNCRVCRGSRQRQAGVKAIGEGADTALPVSDGNEAVHHG